MKNFTVHVKRGEGITGRTVSADYWYILDNGTLAFYVNGSMVRAFALGYWKEVN